MKKYILLTIFICSINLTWGNDYIKERKINAELIRPVGIENENLILLSVAIDQFEDTTKCYAPLECSKNLPNLKDISEHVLRKSYTKVTPHILEKNVKLNKITDELEDIIPYADKNTTVIIILASHGSYDNNEYYFIATDTDSKNLSKTAISSTYLCNIFNKMAYNGAKVLVFIDTCYGEALYKDHCNNSNVYYFASSTASQTSKEYDGKSAMTHKFYELLSSKIDCSTGYISLYDIAYTLKDIVDRSAKQDFCSYPDIDTIKKNNFNVLRYIEDLPPFNTEALIPWKMSNKRKGVDVTLVTLEGVSLASIIACGIGQEVCKCKINKMETDFEAMKYRQYGKNFAWGCCASATVFLTSYIWRLCNVQWEYRKNFEKNSSFDTSTLSFRVNPYLAQDHTGISMIINF